jgi:hypothetical protein
MKTELTIRNCDLFAFQCPKRWSELAQTNSSDVRHCSVCERDVYLCTTDEQTIQHAKAGDCIARELPANGQFGTMVLGKPKKPIVRTPKQEEAYQRLILEFGIDDSIRNANCGRSCPQCNYPAPKWRVTCRVCGFKMGRALDE